MRNALTARRPGACILAAAAALVAAPAVGQGTDAKKDEGKPGQRTISISVPQESEYYVRLLPSDDATKPSQLPLGPYKEKKFTITYDASGLGKSPRIAVDDAKTGNSAIHPPSGKFSQDGTTLDLGRIDFDTIRDVAVKVTYDNKPVTVAQVTLEGSDKKPRSKTIDRVAEGTARFEDVPAGKAKLTIVYGDKLTETKDVELSTDHPAPSLTINAPVTNKVATLDVPAPAGGTATPAGQPAGSSAAGAPPSGGQSQGPRRDEGGNGGGLTSILGTLIGLAAAGGIIYLLYRWAQSGGMAATLKKAGIEVSGHAPSDAGTPWNPNAAAPPVVSDPSICQFCGQKKDAAGNCACTLSGAAIPTGPASPAIPTQPRLVGTMGVYSGSIFPLNGGTISVGREPTNAVALPNDTTVSRRHASITGDGGSYSVSDEGSSNGVYVNGVRISGAQPINPGDELQIGNTRFRFEV